MSIISVRAESLAEEGPFFVEDYMKAYPETNRSNLTRELKMMADRGDLHREMAQLHNLPRYKYSLPGRVPQ